MAELSFAESYRTHGFALEINGTHTTACITPRGNCEERPAHVS